jgi:hypothetical protein
MDLRAVIFVPALVGAAICVFMLALFAADYYLTVLESTATGSREVQWAPGETFTNFWKPFYLAWLLCLWLGPAYVLGRALAGSTGASWLQLAVPVFVAWALFPVSQLSSLCASSLWIPLHPQVFARLAQKPATTLGFFLLALPLFALGGLAFKWAFLTEREWVLLFAGTPLLALAGFLYARLLGRLAFALMFTRDLFKRKKKKKVAKEDERTGDPDTEGTVRPPEDSPDDSPEEPKPERVQPSELPPINTPDGELAGYNILMADDPPVPKKRVRAEVAEDEPPPEPTPAPPAPAPSRRVAKPAHPLDRARTWTEDDDDATPYGVSPSEVKDKERIPEEVMKPTKEDMALLDRRDVPKAPKRTWSLDLFTFLLQPGTIAALLIVIMIANCAGVMVRVARIFNPVAGGE